MVVGCGWFYRCFILPPKPMGRFTCILGDLRRLGSRRSMDERLEQLWDRFH
ncbi:hypothetical protein LINPERHAP1_LOCUS9985 [Linum perenne]